jgi:hypothetical protein
MFGQIIVNAKGVLAVIAKIFPIAQPAHGAMNCMGAGSVALATTTVDIP